MKIQTHTFLLFLATSFAICTTSFDAKSQVTDKKENVENNNSREAVFIKVEKEPTFKGGEKAWLNFFSKTVDFSNVKAPVGTYTIVVQFIVEKDGTLTEVKPLTKHGHGLEEEAIRIMKNAPAMNPAIQNKHVVRAYKKYNLTFVIS